MSIATWRKGRFREERALEVSARLGSLALNGQGGQVAWPAALEVYFQLRTWVATLPYAATNGEQTFGWHLGRHVSYPADFRRSLS
jgi:hypothetical protein